MQTVMALGLPLKLDELAEGLGNCFPIKIIQQLKRTEIFSQLRAKPKRLVACKTGHSMLRLVAEPRASTAVLLTSLTLVDIESGLYTTPW